MIIVVRFAVLQTYLYIEMLLSTFCICSLEHGEPMYVSNQ